MIPNDIDVLCSELAIRIKQLSPHHFRLHFEDSEMTVDFWPSTGRIGIVDCKSEQPADVKFWIIEAWEKSFSFKKKISNGMKDTDLMTFGKHKGKALANVPDQYLTWLYDQMDERQKKQPLAKYIEDNFNVVVKKGAIK